MPSKFSDGSRWVRARAALLVVVLRMNPGSRRVVHRRHCDTSYGFGKLGDWMGVRLVVRGSNAGSVIFRMTRGSDSRRPGTGPGGAHLAAGGLSMTIGKRDT